MVRKCESLLMNKDKELSFAEKTGGIVGCWLFGIVTFRLVYGPWPQDTNNMLWFLFDSKGRWSLLAGLIAGFVGNIIGRIVAKLIESK